MEIMISTFERERERERD